MFAFGSFLLASLKRCFGMEAPPSMMSSRELSPSEARVEEMRSARIVGTPTVLVMRCCLMRRMAENSQIGAKLE